MIDLKIVHLNTYDGNGGAGRACLRLNDALQQAGVASQMLTFYKFGNNPNIANFSARPFGRAMAIFNIFAERFLAKWLTKKVKTPFSLQWFGSAIHQHPLIKDADIIHIHWINHGFLTPKNLAQLARLEKPIVWTFHDSNAFTGGCHVRYNCENYHRQCGQCPLLWLGGDNDISHRNWLRKQKAYSQLNFHIVAPSVWMQQSARQSSLLGLRKSTVIANTIEISVFKPYVKVEAKKILRIAPHKFVMMSGFMPSKNDKHKGTEYLLAALQELAKRPQINSHEIELVIFGNKTDQNMPQFPFKTTFLGAISKDDHLAKCYAAADVFITASLEDNLPNTVMESLACATPVVAFETGGIPDMVKHMENGYLAKYKSATDLANGIEWLYLSTNRAQIQKQARLTVLQEFAPTLIVQKHIELYQDLIRANKQ